LKKNATNSEQCEVCLASLNLTEQKSEHALHQSLMEAMKHYFHALHVSFYRIHLMDKKEEGDAAWHLHADDEQQHDTSRLLASEALKTCLNYQSVTCECCDEQGDTFIRYYAAIPLVKSNMGLLVFDVQDKINAYQHHKLEKIILLFRNCDAHLTAFHHDVLTGLANRMSMNEAIKRQLLKHQHNNHRRRAEVGKFPALCMLDIDFFKRVNDDFGHLYGDEVLLLFSRLMRECFRDMDQLFRYGGEEFMVILNCFDDEDTFKVLNRFREKVANYDFPQVGKVTVSIGFSRFDASILPNEIVEYADKALYFAKEHGRNQVASYQALLETGEIVPSHSTHQAELF